MTQIRHETYRNGKLIETVFLSGSAYRQAIALLEESDRVAIRCFKAGMSFPKEWKEYVDILRTITNGEDVAMPNKPKYPVGS